MRNFNGLRFPIDVIPGRIRWNVACPLTLRHLEEEMEELGDAVDNSSIKLWAVRFLPIIQSLPRQHNCPVDCNWHMNERQPKF